ncbi:hypothetical protein BD626DRAFT_522897 [Schizophyllum amplum]|uniref:Secreted protein n=1 Tax=Schizophyllum amplum TaxID=97359 RepID=A0A550BT83_9AGAR|nr:hypothetical protein BD626DRAFT_522897 [Auriculariopsis ampla]
MGRRRWWLTFVTTPATSFRSAALWSSAVLAVAGPRAAPRCQSAQRITPHVHRLAHTRTHNIAASSAITHASHVRSTAAWRASG